MELKRVSFYSTAGGLETNQKRTRTGTIVMGSVSIKTQYYFPGCTLAALLCTEVNRFVGFLSEMEVQIIY